MADRYRERLHLAIVQRPGISLTELTPKTQRLSGPERRQLIGELIASGRVVERIERPSHGPLKPTYWPAGA
jgi:hypothetical protein